MNDDKPAATVTLCPTCQVAMEYVDGETRCLCHECGSIWSYRLLADAAKYPTADNPIQEISIYYDSGTQVFPADQRGKKLEGLDE